MKFNSKISLCAFLLVACGISSNSLFAKSNEDIGREVGKKADQAVERAREVAEHAKETAQKERENAKNEALKADQKAHELNEQTKKRAHEAIEKS